MPQRVERTVDEDGAHADAGKDFRVRPIGNKFLVSEPRIGAFSLLEAPDLLVFYALRMDRHIDVAQMYEGFGFSPQQAASRAARIHAKFKDDGWERTALPPLEQVQSDPLHVVYFTITRVCNFKCQYCYQGLPERHTHMSLENVDIILGKIKAINPNCFVVVTGGEPMAHPEFLRIVDRVEDFGFSFCVLSNGTLLTRDIARHLSQKSKLRYVQVSLDGIVKETHNHTREHFERVIAAIRCLNEEGVFPIVSPTLHEGNRHEIRSIAEFAHDNGGTFTVNPAKALPRSPDPADVPLSEDTLFDFMLDMARNPPPNREIPGSVPIEPIELVANQTGVEDKHMVGICGMAHALMNIDWNGDIFPCHLLRYDELKLGNVVAGSFDEVFEQVKAKRIRVPSWEIPKCSQCDWVLSCGGGCRAGAYAKYRSLEREDGMCSLRYRAQETTLQHQAGAFELPEPPST